MILINGYFLCRRLTGIERYAYEITKCLDALCCPGEIAVLVPANAPPVAYTNLHVIRHRSPVTSYMKWQMITMQLFLLTHKQYIVLDFGNTCLPFAPGISFLHDIYCEFYPTDFTTLRDRLIRLYYCVQYRLIARRAKQVCTVSCFSRDQIAATYGIDPANIAVIYSSADHMRDITPDDSVFDTFPGLRDRPFYFSLGSLSKRKNISWIVKYAAAHPTGLFALSGTALPTVQVDDVNAAPPNILLLGYLDDGKVKSLMQHCKAFLLPSYYEGFGLTPLEALTCGAPIVVANAASLPEIYGTTAHYINPFDTSADLDALLAESITDPMPLFAKYSYDTAAKRVLDICRGALLDKKTAQL